jgi:hypothetical protein
MTAKFAAYDSLAIYAIADTAEAAIAQARADTMEPEAQFKVAKISNSLATWIDENGWNAKARSFGLRDGYVVDTTET